MNNSNQRVPSKKPNLEKGQKNEQESEKKFTDKARKKQEADNHNVGGF